MADDGQVMCAGGGVDWVVRVAVLQVVMLGTTRAPEKDLEEIAEVARAAEVLAIAEVTEVEVEMRGQVLYEGTGEDPRGE